MATVTVRQLDDELYEDLRTQAKANNRSVEAEVRQLIASHVPRRRNLERLVKELRVHRERMGEKYGILSDSTQIIRQMRDEE